MLSNGCRLLFGVFCLLYGVCRALFLVRRHCCLLTDCLVAGVCCSWFVVCCLSCVVRRVLFVACCLLLCGRVRSCGFLRFLACCCVMIFVVAFGALLVSCCSSFGV